MNSQNRKISEYQTLDLIRWNVFYQQQNWAIKWINIIFTEFYTTWQHLTAINQPRTHKLFFINRRRTQTFGRATCSAKTFISRFFIPRQRDDVPFNRAGRAIKKSAIVCVGLAVNIAPTRILSEINSLYTGFRCQHKDPGFRIQRFKVK